MTRREAIGKFQVVTKHSGGETWEENNGIEVIDKIYDDFESRTCENCKHFHIKSSTCNMIMNGQEYLDYIFVAKDFSCNKFERKDK